MPHKNLKIEVNNAVFSLPYHVAQDKGFFREEGLDVELIPAGSGRDRERMHLRPAPVWFDVRHVDENEQAEALGKPSGEADLLSRGKPQIGDDADVDAAGTILNREALIEGARAERARRHRDRAVDRDHGPQWEAARFCHGDRLRSGWRRMGGIRSHGEQECDEGQSRCGSPDRRERHS